MYQLKDLRLLSLIFAHLTLISYMLGIILEFYLIFKYQDLVGFVIGLYLAYLLLTNLTLVPESAVIIMQESQLNIFETEGEKVDWFPFFDFIIKIVAKFMDQIYSN